MNKTALIIIDIQNDYFPEGKFALDNTEQTLNNIKQAIKIANANNFTIIHVQHLGGTEADGAPFFIEETEGVNIHNDVIAAAPDATIITKRHADSFLNTRLDEELQSKNISELLICGMMTQNCVTHTALSKKADEYQVKVLPECCTTVDGITNALALMALGDRLPLIHLSQL